MTSIETSRFSDTLGADHAGPSSSGCWSGNETSRRFAPFRRETRGASRDPARSSLSVSRGMGGQRRRVRGSTSHTGYGPPLGHLTMPSDNHNNEKGVGP